MKKLREQRLYKAHKHKKKQSVPVPLELQQKRVLALLAKPLTHATKVTATQALGCLPPTHTCAKLVLERYLGHHPALFTLPGIVGTGLHRMLEELRAQANDMLQERHCQGSMYRNVIQHHKCQARWYSRHARRVTRCFLTALRHPTLKQMVFWKGGVTHQLQCTGGWVYTHQKPWSVSTEP